jgi:hypothetical protein
MRLLELKRLHKYYEDTNNESMATFIENTLKAQEDLEKLYKNADQANVYSIRAATGCNYITAVEHEVLFEGNVEAAIIKINKYGQT